LRRFVWGIYGANKKWNAWSLGDVFQLGQQEKKGDRQRRIYKILTSKEGADTNERSTCSV